MNITKEITSQIVIIMDVLLIHIYFDDTVLSFYLCFHD